MPPATGATQEPRTSHCEAVRYAALARAIACGGAFTAVNVAYLVAIEACRWRMHVHVKRTRAA